MLGGGIEVLIIYKVSSGEVVENQGILDSYPQGINDIDPVIENITMRFGGNMEDYSILRLNDIENADLVKKTFTHEYTVQNGEIVFGELKPISEPEPQPPTEIEKLRIETAQANAEMFEMLLMMTGGTT